MAKPEESPLPIIDNDYLAANLAEFLFKNGFTKDRGGRVFLYPAGKNFASFDLQFIKNLPKYQHNLHISHQAIDPGSLYLRVKDKKMPNLETCIERAKLVDDEVTHDALNEAIVVIKLIRKHYKIDVTE
jgi:hypothetical protein